MDVNEIRILLVDDDEDDYIITRELLEDIDFNEFRLDWVDNYDDAIEIILKNEHDVYLFDYRLGSKSGMQLLKHAIERGCQAPIILLTGQGDREVDVEAMKSGASDFLAKGQLNAPLLERSIRYSIERSQSEQKLAHLAQYDSLTGLPNRLLFNDRLHQAIALAGRTSTLVGLLFIDLDRFKKVNDTLGHDAGDLLLKEVSRRLVNCVRDCDTVARIGGDEFVLILATLNDTASASIVAERVVDSIKPGIIIGGEEVYVAASVGASFFPFDGQEADTLIKVADTAMYKAKADGGSCYRFFSVDVNGQAKSQLLLESNLHHGLEREEFFIEYLPIVSLSNNTIMGVEALLRWQPKDSELVAPEIFLPLLNDTGLINTVGQWALRKACADLKDFHRAGFDDLRLTVNFSSRQLRQDGVVDIIAKVLADLSVSPRYLELELNEDALMRHFQENIHIFNDLTKMGVCLSLDDFGIGFCSLSSLKSYPLSRLKIDRSFVGNVCTSKSDAAIARAIISLGHSLDMQVTAEGIESKEQYDFMVENGCDAGQGNYFTPSLTPDKVLGFFRQRV